MLYAGLTSKLHRRLWFSEQFGELVEIFVELLFDAVQLSKFLKRLVHAEVELDLRLCA